MFALPIGNDRWVGDSWDMILAEGSHTWLFRQDRSQPSQEVCTCKQLLLSPSNASHNSNRVPYNMLIKFDNKITVNLVHRKFEKNTFTLLFQGDIAKDLFIHFVQDRISSWSANRDGFVFPDAKFVANANLFSETNA